MIKILVVDDQRLVRRCISAKLSATDDFDVIGEADSGERAREIVRNQTIDIVLMDLNMPGMGGLEATRHVVSGDPNCKVIGLSVYVDGPYPRRFMEIGGSGYVSKGADTDELVHAIRTVASGAPYISKDVAQRIAINDSMSGTLDGVNALSSREIQVLQKISQGLNVDEIARAICLSPKTIARHRRSLCEKLGATNDVQLAIIANAQGLSELVEIGSAAEDLDDLQLS
ncbi:MAG: response regulator [Proteobacteria bacterium]|nr:response regulator [Pseudomonadota bacterium]